MKYIVCQKPGRFELLEKEEPICGEQEVLVEIKNIGICGTDLHAFQGNQAFFRYPRILGHELGALVLQVGKAVNGISVGEKVAILPYLSCGKCIACRKGKTNCCRNIQVLGVHIDGGMQERIAVPVNNVLSIEGLKYDAIAIIEPLAIAAHALRRADLEQGETVVVVGCGPIGLGIMKLAKLRGARVIAVDVVPQRLQFAREKMGVDHTINARQTPLETLTKITNGDLATTVFDASGNKKALESGVEYMAHGGTYVLVGLSKGALTFTHPAIHAKETSLLCSRNATMEDFQAVVKVLKSGEFPVEEFVTHRVHFDEMLEHFEKWTDPKAGVIKALVHL